MPSLEPASLAAARADRHAVQPSRPHAGPAARSAHDLDDGRTRARPLPSGRQRRLAPGRHLRRDGRPGHQRRADRRLRRLVGRQQDGRARRHGRVSSPAPSRWPPASTPRCSRRTRRSRPRSTSSDWSCTGTRTPSAANSPTPTSRAVSTGRSPTRSPSSSPGTRNRRSRSTRARNSGSTRTSCPRPWVAAGSSFVAFAVGAFVPLLPYLLGATSLVLSLGARRARTVPRRCRRRTLHVTLRALQRNAAAAPRRRRRGRHLSGRHALPRRRRLTRNSRPTRSAGVRPNSRLHPGSDLGVSPRCAGVPRARVICITRVGVNGTPAGSYRSRRRTLDATASGLTADACRTGRPRTRAGRDT